MALTTLANVRLLLAYAATDTSDDARITALIAHVTDEIERYCGRIFDAATLTEYPRPLSRASWAVQVARPPINSITSVDVTTTLPRVYDADSLLATDQYTFDANAGIIQRVSGRFFPNPEFWGDKMIRVVYNGGFSTIPPIVEKVAVGIISNNLFKLKGRLGHVTSVDRGDGGISGIRFEDISNDDKRILDQFVVNTA